MKVPFLKNLLDRRVPRIFGVYVGGSWGILQFVDWLEKRYVLSPHLTTFSLVILVSLIPTVLIVAYLHGKPGRDKWTKLEKIGIPTNLLFTILLLFLLFYGKNLGAATEKITVENEEGNRVERVVPKREFRKSVAIFNFENKSGDAELDWLQFGLSLWLRYDLYQDFFLETIIMSDSSSFYDRMKDAGFPELVGLPFSLERKIAADYYMHYFLTGDFTQSENQLTVKTALYETERGKSIAERTITGGDIFTLIDRITVQLKRDLGLPDYQLQETVDLPVSEVATNSLDAMKLMTLGAKAMLIERDYEAALQYFEQSVQVDPTCAVAYFSIGSINFELKQQEKARKAFEQALKYKYKLPGSIEYFVKDLYFTLTGDAEKAFKVRKMRVELYPDDTVARSNLIAAYINREQLDKAITEYNKLIEIAPEPSKYYHDIGKVYLDKGVFDEALKYYQRYADEFPDEARSFKKLAELYEAMGDIQQAKTASERALLLE
ncbi:tetratricopeptide repeat protein [bacterium]|nr:tetratricopeptide repeat protein [bacterium]